MEFVFHRFYLARGNATELLVKPPGFSTILHGQCPCTSGNSLASALAVRVFRSADMQGLELKEELALIKAEMAAEALEEEAEALLRRDEERKAMKLFKKILGKRYAATETAKRVRERFPELE